MGPSHFFCHFREPTEFPRLLKYWRGVCSLGLHLICLVLLETCIAEVHGLGDVSILEPLRSWYCFIMFYLCICACHSVFSGSWSLNTIRIHRLIDTSTHPLSPQYVGMLRWSHSQVSVGSSFGTRVSRLPLCRSSCTSHLPWLAPLASKRERWNWVNGMLDPVRLNGVCDDDVQCDFTVDVSQVIQEHTNWDSGHEYVTVAYSHGVDYIMMIWRTFAMPCCAGMLALSCTSGGSVSGLPCGSALLRCWCLSIHVDPTVFNCHFPVLFVVHGIGKSASHAIVHVQDLLAQCGSQIRFFF